MEILHTYNMENMKNICCSYMMAVLSWGAFILWGFCPRELLSWGFCPKRVLSGGGGGPTLTLSICSEGLYTMK